MIQKTKINEERRLYIYKYQNRLMSLRIMSWRLE